MGDQEGCDQGRGGGPGAHPRRDGAEVVRRSGPREPAVVRIVFPRRRPGSSRTKARKTLSVEDLESQMAGRSWQASDAKSLLDEAPQAYKPIDVVMRDHADLVEVEVELSSIATYKGVERR